MGVRVGVSALMLGDGGGGRSPALLLPANGGGSKALARIHKGHFNVYNNLADDAEPIERIPYRLSGLNIDIGKRTMTRTMTHDDKAQLDTSVHDSLGERGLKLPVLALKVPGSTFGFKKAVDLNFWASPDEYGRAALVKLIEENWNKEESLKFYAIENVLPQGSWNGLDRFTGGAVIPGAGFFWPNDFPT